MNNIADKTKNTEVKFLTQSEAREIYSQDEVSTYPTPFLNELGKSTIDAWLKVFALELVACDSFYAAAEFEAAAMLLGSAGTIELGALLSKDRSPKTLTLENDYFDWLL